MMPIAKTMAESNEAYYLEHGRYSEDPTELIVQGKDTEQEPYPDGTTILMYSNEDDLSFVRTENTSIPNARYVVYQKHSKNFADTTWCEAGDERAEAMCVALGGVIPDGVSGNSGMDADWTAYLLSGQVGDGDSFAEAGTNSGTDTPAATCNEADKPSDISPTQTNPATGTATCVNGHWKYQWTGGKVYGTHYESWTTVCTGDPAYECAGAEFKGYFNQCDATQEGGCASSTFSGRALCKGDAVDGCAESTFSGKYSTCEGNAANSCVDSTFSGDYSKCEGNAAYACTGSTFSGDHSKCEGNAAYACTGSTFTGMTSVCRGNVTNGCANITFSEDGVDCYGTAANGCAGSVFSGKESRCIAYADNGCAGTEIQAGTYCLSDTAHGCDGAKYGANPDKDPNLIGSCSGGVYGGKCPTGVPLTGDWNDSTGSYDISGWKGDCCNPAYMVSGTCPSGIAVCPTN